VTPQEAADHIALNALVVNYAVAADNKDYDGYAALFLPEGTITGRVVGATEPFVHVQGRDAISAVLHGNDAFVQTFHGIENHRCEVNGDSATGITYCLARHYRETDGAAEVIIAPLRYYDDYVRTPDGWRFAAREIHFTWIEKAVADPTEFANWTRLG
jgi:hypothetical protein